MEHQKAMECGSRKASSDVLKPRNIYIYRSILVPYCYIKLLRTLTFEIRRLRPFGTPLFVKSPKIIRGPNADTKCRNNNFVLVTSYVERFIQ
jgi:hypothetical protein